MWMLQRTVHEHTLFVLAESSQQAECRQRLACRGPKADTPFVHITGMRCPVSLLTTQSCSLMYKQHFRLC
jgi:hypothetical protein